MSAILTFSDLPVSADWSEAQGHTASSFGDSPPVDDSLPVTFVALNVVTPATPTGIVIESGGSGDGMALSFDSSGNLVGAAGQGNTTNTDNNTVFVTVDGSNLSNKRLDIYWCISPQAPGRAKLYVFDTITRELLGMSYADTLDSSRLGTQDALGDWTGSNNVGVGVNSSGTRLGVNTSSFNGTLTNGVSAYSDYLPADFTSNTYDAVTFNAAYYGQAVYGSSKYGQFTVSDLPQAVATGQVSGVTVNTTAGITGVSAIGSIRPIGIGQFEIDIFEVLESVSATGSVTAVQPNVSEPLNSVSAEGFVNDNWVIKSVNRVPVNGVQGTTAVTAVQPNITEIVTGVSAQGFANSVTVPIVQPVTTPAITTTVEDLTVGSFEVDVTEVVESVSANTSLNAVTVNVTEIVESVSANTTVNAVAINIIEFIESVSANTSVNAVTVNVTEVVESVVANTNVNEITINVTEVVESVVANTNITTVTINIIEFIESVFATGFVSAAQVNTTEKITGVEATGQIANLAVGQFEVDISEVITAGVAGTLATPSVQPNVSELLGSVSSTTAVNGVTVPVVQPVTTPAITATVESLAVGGFEVDISEAIPTGVFGTANITAVQPNITEKVTGVSATGAIGSFTFSSTTNVNSVVGTFETPNVQPNVSEALNSVFATSDVSAVTVHTSELLNSVEATGSANTVKVNTTAGITGVTATGAIGTPEVQPAEVLLSVSAIGTVNNVQVNTAAGFTTPALVITLGNVTQTAVQFDFEAVKTLYSPKRTVILSRAA